MPEHVAAANATTGINILVLHFGLRYHDLSDVRTAQVLAVGSAAFVFFRGGCQVYHQRGLWRRKRPPVWGPAGFASSRDFQKRSQTLALKRI